jgi:pimeloyl-ACP methyl ester carboxylesterase
MRSHFIDVDGLQIHVRSAGSGLPVVLWHPSPLSGTAVWPLAQVLAQHFRVHAFDTPGYGLSDPLPARPQSLDDYLPLFARALDALGVQRCALYGAATGAQLAVEFAKRYPERVAQLVLDSAGHIEADECERIVRDYFPDVTPQSDGRHLVTLWQMVRDLFVFFPWCDTRDVSRIDRDLPPPAVMQGMLLDYLRAGTRYDWAYRPAFHNERAERTQAVSVPAALVRWQGSIALRITDALIAAGLPQNFSVLHSGPSLAERYQAISDWLRQRHTDGYAAARDAAVASGGVPRGDRLRRDMLETAAGRLHLWRCDAGTGKPLLLLHSGTGSSASLLPLARIAVGHRPVYALDLPGHGESRPAAAEEPASVEWAARVVEAALDELGHDQVEVIGQHYGALVGLELAHQRPQRVQRLVAVGLPWLMAEESVAAASDAAPSIAPLPDGTHLLRAWYMMRDSALWFPHHRTERSRALRVDPQFDAAAIHSRVVELMKIGDRYRDVLRAQAEYPVASRLGESRIELVLARVPGDGFGLRAEFAAAAAARARVLDLPRDQAEWLAALTEKT